MDQRDITAIISPVGVGRELVLVRKNRFGFAGSEEGNKHSWLLRERWCCDAKGFIIAVCHSDTLETWLVAVYAPHTACLLRGRFIEFLRVEMRSGGAVGWVKRSLTA